MKRACHLTVMRDYYVCVFFRFDDFWFCTSFSSSERPFLSAKCSEGCSICEATPIQQWEWYSGQERVQRLQWVSLTTPCQINWRPTFICLLPLLHVVTAPIYGSYSGYPAICFIRTCMVWCCLCYCSALGVGDVEGFADDYAFLIGGLIDLFEASHEEMWLEWASLLQQKMVELFWDEDRGGFYSTTDTDQSILLRIKEGIVTVCELQHLGYCMYLHPAITCLTGRQLIVSGRLV